jgi:hypothetical protein
MTFSFQIIYYPKKYVNFQLLKFQNFLKSGTLVFMTFSFEISYYPKTHVNISTFEISNFKKTWVKSLKILQLIGFEPCTCGLEKSTPTTRPPHLLCSILSF